MVAKPVITGRLRHLSDWPDPAGRLAYEDAYQQVLDELWPVPYESRLVTTGYGATHVLVSGDPEAPPLVAFHGAGLSAASWYTNVAALTEHHRIYAVEAVFDRGRGTQTGLVRTATDCAQWATEVLDGLQLDRTAVVGLSQGGWVAAAFATAQPDRGSRLALLAPVGALRWLTMPTLVARRQGGALRHRQGPRPRPPAPPGPDRRHRGRGRPLHRHVRTDRGRPAAGLLLDPSPAWDAGLTHDQAPRVPPAPPTY
jgi:pimeloyl-ACP methyl ester carboxylesterase